MTEPPNNFSFLDPVDPRLSRLAGQAESYVHTDPESCLFKLRLMVETMASTLIRLSIQQPGPLDLGAMLGTLERQGVLPRHYADHMHAIRRDGNAAVHGDAAPSSTALRRLRDAFALARWYFTQLRRGSRMPDAAFSPPLRDVAASGASSDAAEALEDRIETQRTRTRDALLLYKDAEEAAAWSVRCFGELRALEDIAAAVGEPLVDAESVALVMALELEQLLEHPVYGKGSRDARRDAADQLEAVKRRLDEQEARFRSERERLIGELRP